MLLLTEYYPDRWKGNRTTLIPKDGKDLNDIKNWRPITIRSIIGRIFSGILDARLRLYIKQAVRQKGFIKEDGCKANINLLEAALHRMKAAEKGVITIVDIAKAFNTVPHSAVRQGLRRKGTPPVVVDYIAKMYAGCHTQIKARNEEKVNIELKLGVKQGDPLSPLLFNLITDTIIEDIDKNTQGIKIQDENLAVLAFADDMVLLANNKMETKR